MDFGCYDFAPRILSRDNARFHTKTPLLSRDSCIRVAYRFSSIVRPERRNIPAFSRKGNIVNHSYDSAVRILQTLYGASIRQARKLLADCRNGKPLTMGLRVGNYRLYYRSDKTYEMVSE